MKPGKSKLNWQFLLQLALIVLPLLVLSAVGFYFLRQDKHLVEQEAREKAAQLAASLTSTISGVLTNLPLHDSKEGRPLFWPGGFRLELTSDGKLASPPALIELSDLHSAEAQQAFDLWQRALNFAQAQQFNEANELLSEILPLCVKNKFRTPLPNGFPLGHAALLKRLELQVKHELTNSTEIARTASRLYSYAVEFPTPASQFLFDQAHGLAAFCKQARQAHEYWHPLFQQHEAARLVYESVAPQLSTHISNTNSPPSPVLFSHNNDFWWAVSRQDRTSSPEATLTLICQSRSHLSQLIRDTVASLNPPAYLDFDAISGISMLANPPATNLLILASISGPISIRANLSNPQALFRYQRQRALWFSVIIGISFLLAIAGAANAFLSLRKEQRLNELKSNFVSSVSHELRAPLASMRLLSEGLQTGRVTAPEKQREYFSYLVQECRRLSVLVENVLDFSRIEQNRKTYNFEEVDLRALAIQSLNILQPAALEQQIQLELDLPPADHPLTTQADPHALQQAILNLLDNAIKHSKAGQSVQLSARNGNDALRISVTDHGPGIPPHEHEKIFARFYRLGSELRRETPGVGIGLSIVKHIVQAHRGEIELQSAPGQGSTFTIVLPKA